MPTDNPIRIETVFQSMHTSLMKQVVEETCPRHGLYRSYVTILGGQEVGHTGCPECARLEKIADEKAALEELQRQVAAEEARKAEEALRRSRVPSDFKGKTFETFVAETETQKQALALSKRFADHWDIVSEKGYGLFFYGNPGTGKSHLACSIIQHLLPGIFGLYVRVSDIIGYVRSCWGGRSDQSDFEAERMFIEAPLLVIDELGIQAGSQNEQRILFSVIDGRLSENRPTIFLSNLKLEDLVPILGPRITDRIRGKCVQLFFNGKSHRRSLTAEDFFKEAA